MTLPQRSVLEVCTQALVDVQAAEIKAYLAGEIAAGAWRPEKWAEAVLTALRDDSDAQKPVVGMWGKYERALKRIANQPVADTNREERRIAREALA